MITLRGSIARNTLLNLAGQAAPFLVGLIAIPFTVRGLGTDRFGVLGLVWLVVGYFTLLDLGMGRAATRFAADAIGRRAYDEIAGITWSAVGVQAIVGVAGGILAGLLAPVLVQSVLRVPADLEAEAVTAFRILAIAIPVVLVAASFRGLLEAARRFDLVNLVSVPGSALNFLVPLIGALLGWGLPPIVAIMVLARGTTLVAYFLCARHLFPAITQPRRASLAGARSLLNFGAWVTVSNVVSPVLDQLDRLLLGAFAGVGSVGFYTPPQEAVLRIRALPTALAATLVPEFSSQATAAAVDRARGYYAIAIRVLALLLAPATLALVLLGHDFLRLWLGDSFALTSTTALRMLAMGALVNALAYVPLTFLHGVNRPDLPAKFHAVELPGFLLLAWFLMPRYGVSGAGIAWATRAGADALLLFLGAAACGAGPSLVRPTRLTWAWILALAAGLVVAFTPGWAALNAWLRGGLAIAASALLLLFGWHALLRSEDRARLRSRLGTLGGTP